MFLFLFFCSKKKKKPAVSSRALYLSSPRYAHVLFEEQDFPLPRWGSDWSIQVHVRYRIPSGLPGRQSIQSTPWTPQQLVLGPCMWLPSALDEGYRVKGTCQMRRVLSVSPQGAGLPLTPCALPKLR